MPVTRNPLPAYTVSEEHCHLLLGVVKGSQPVQNLLQEGRGLLYEHTHKHGWQLLRHCHQLLHTRHTLALTPLVGEVVGEIVQENL